jgi:hypothetical protein
MSLSTWYDSLINAIGGYLPNILGALAILVVGWIIALIARALTRSGLAAARVNERLAVRIHSTVDMEKSAARIVFWGIFLVALIGAFNVLRLEAISRPLSNLAEAIMLYLPRLLLAAVLALLAWLLAAVVRAVVGTIAGAIGLDQRLSQTADVQPVAGTIGNVLFWLVILLFLPAIVGVLKIEGLITPLSDMIAKLLAALPNVFAAVIIGVVGWLIAKVLGSLVTNILAALDVDRLAQRVEVAEGLQLARLGGTLAFILVLVPALIAALDALKLDAVSSPARNMLTLFLEAIPNILAAAAILIIAWFVGRFVADLLTRLLASLGIDRLPARLGLGAAFGDGTSLSALLGRIALFFIMLFATVEAANRLGFMGVSNLIGTLITFGSNILLGLVILAVGYWLANLAVTAIQRAGADYGALSQIARVAILGLVIAMGLRAMGIADQIVNLAFGLTLGAVAVAVALAFGLGGRDAARQVAQHWVDRFLGRDGTPRQ